MTTPSTDPGEILAFASRFWELMGAPLERDGRAFKVELPAHLEGHFGTRTLRFALTAEEAWISGAELLAPGSFLLARMHEHIRERGSRAVFQHPPTSPSPTASAVKEEVASRIRVCDAQVAAVTSAEAWPVRLAIDVKVVYQTDEIEEDLVRVVEDETGKLHAREVKPGPGWSDVEEASADTVGRLELGALEGRYARALEKARRFALARGRGIEARAVKRLAENLARIQGYFAQIRSEVSGVDERRSERLKELEIEERLKTGEEVDAHRVRIRIVPIAISLLAVPSRRVTLALEAGAASAQLDVLRELRGDRLEAAGIGVVGEEGVSVTVCRDGHVALDHLARPCISCRARSCAAHGADCPRCQGRLCSGCGSRCALCGLLHCPEHAPVSCSRCGRAACAACGESCTTCDSPVCREDARACAVCGAAICVDHVVACACGALVCGRDVVLDPVSQIRYCGKCAITCADCTTPMGKATSQLCGGCGARLCREHARSCASCGKAQVKLCGQHRATCNACGTTTCRTKHRRRCRICAQDSCPSCIDSSGRCALCLDVLRSRQPGERPPLEQLPAEASGVVAWHARKGAVSDLYLGRNGRGAGGVLLVVGHDGKLVRVGKAASL